MNRFVKSLGGLLRLIGFAWLGPLTRIAQVLCSKRRPRPRSERVRKRSPYPCVPINRPEMLRPDPLIYSQYFLMKQGLAVTWDNPDIHLEHNGVTVLSSDLKPSTTYDVIARIWNASPSCPVVGMPVYFSYLAFGIGTVNLPIGKTHVDLGVKGGPGCPAYATMKWTTPAAAGHYCLQVRLAPPDDVNPDNNLGQENTNVGVAHSPAQFRFALRNAEQIDRRFRFEVDAYTIPSPGPCNAADHVGGVTVPQRDQPVDLKREAFGVRGRIASAVIERHTRANHPLPPGWRVDISPAEPTLAPGQEITLEVTVHPPDDFHGTRPININGFVGRNLAGGVTLTVTRP